MIGVLTAAALAGAVRVPSACPYRREVDRAITASAHVYPVPPALVHAVMQQESSCQARAVSRAGARGLMQVMPANARRLGVFPDDLWSPATNILAGVRLLAALLRHYRGDVISALVAYNARPRPLGAPLPRNGETPAYVWRVLGFYRAYERQLGAPRSSLPSRRRP